MSQDSDVMDTSKPGQFGSIKHMFGEDGAFQTRSVNQCLGLSGSCGYVFYFTAWTHAHTLLGPE